MNSPTERTKWLANQLTDHTCIYVTSQDRKVQPTTNKNCVSVTEIHQLARQSACCAHCRTVLSPSLARSIFSIDFIIDDSLTKNVEPFLFPPQYLTFYPPPSKLSGLTNFNIKEITNYKLQIVVRCTALHSGVQTVLATCVLATLFQVG